MFIKDKHLKSLLIAIVFGLSCILLITLFVTGAFKSPLELGWVYAYQTLIVGTAGFATLIFGLYVHNKGLAAKRRLYKVRLYDALSDLSDYYSKCYSYLMSTPKPALLPEKPIEAIGIVKDSVEFLEDNDSRYMAYVTSKYQIFNSRLKNYNQVVGSREHAEKIGDLLFLWWLTDRVWEFSRFESSSIAFVELQDGVLLNKLTFGFLGIVSLKDFHIDHLKIYLDALSRAHNRLKDGFGGLR